MPLLLTFLGQLSQFTIDGKKDSTRSVLTILTACPFISDSCCYSSPFLPFSICARFPKKISHFPLHLLMYSPSVLHAHPFSKVHLSSFASFFNLVLSSPLWLLAPLWDLLRTSALFHLNFLQPPFHHLRPSLQSFCCSEDTKPILFKKHKEKEQSSRLPKTCLVLGRWSLFLPFFPFSSSFLIAVRNVAILSFAFFHQLLLLYFTCFFLSFFFF